MLCQSELRGQSSKSKSHVRVPFERVITSIIARKTDESVYSYRTYFSDYILFWLQYCIAKSYIYPNTIQSHSRDMSI